MISKERLEELIEQGATIYGIDIGCFCRDLMEIKTKNMRYSASNDNFQYLYKESGDCYLYEFYEENLFETKEEAEWHAEFGCIERTDYLDLPTWEEFCMSEKTIFFIDKYGSKYGLDHFSGLIWINENSFGKLTKENYTIACRKAKQLFLGESNEEKKHK